MKNETLTDALHDKFLHCGEILSNSSIAQFIQEIEFETGIEYDTQAILVSTREAGERFVDSMIDNETDESQWAKWEAMRPSVIRRKQIQSILS